jgi:hypothetical protein
VEAWSSNPERKQKMTFSIILTAVLSLGVFVMVVAPLAWAIRTALRDAPAGSAKARLEVGATLVRGPRHGARRAAPQPHFGTTEQGQAWPTTS